MEPKDNQVGSPVHEHQSSWTRVQNWWLRSLLAVTALINDEAQPKW